MICIAIAVEAFDAVAAILPGSERDPDDTASERLIWLARVAGSKLAPATA
jgi:hypothetical protein